MEMFFEFIASIIGFAALAVIVMWKCAGVGFLWIFVPRNHVILLDKGEGNPYRVLFHNTSRMFGIHWMGMPPVDVHKFPLVHRRMNQKIGKETLHQDWMISDPEPETETFLLETVTNWTYVPGFEFVGGQRADILFQYQATVDGECGARTAVYDREGKFYEILDSVIESNTISLAQLRGMTYDQFMKVEKDENSPLMDNRKTPGNPNGLLQEINKTAGTRSGYLLDSIFVRRFDASSQSEQELALEKKKAQIQAAAAKIKAKGDVADVTEIIRLIKKQLPDAEETVILQEVARLGVAKRLAESTTLQAVGGAMLGLSSNNNQKSNKKGNK